LLTCDHRRCARCRTDYVCCECESLDGCREWSCIYHGNLNRERVTFHRAHLDPASSAPSRRITAFDDITWDAANG
jgi:hypothetical protein